MVREIDVEISEYRQVVFTRGCERERTPPTFLSLPALYVLVLVAVVSPLLHDAELGLRRVETFATLLDVVLRGLVIGSDAHEAHVEEVDLHPQLHRQGVHETLLLHWHLLRKLPHVPQHASVGSHRVVRAESQSFRRGVSPHTPRPQLYVPPPSLDTPFQRRLSSHPPMSDRMRHVTTHIPQFIAAS